MREIAGADMLPHVLCQPAGGAGSPALYRARCWQIKAMKGRDRAMNRFERLFGFRGEAKVKYLDGEFQVVAPGDYVLCAVSGEPIPLAELRYWSVELQEPYATAEVSLQRYIEARQRGVSAG